MTRRLVPLALLAWLVLALSGCVLGKLVGAGAGAVRFTGRWPAAAVGGLGTRAELSDVKVIDVTLSGEGMAQPQRRREVQTTPAQETFTILFESVPLGRKDVGVTLLDTNGNVLTSARAAVVVAGGQTVDAVIKLSLGGPAVIVSPSPSPSPSPAVSLGTATPTPSPVPTVFVVTTLAGNGTAGFQNGPALSAQFNSPLDVGVDGSGNVYVSDNNNLRVRKIDTSGNVSTWAGSGTSGTNNGVGTAAQFTSVFHLTVDAGGNLYLSDNNIHQIRKIDPGQTVTTWAGSGASGTNNGVGVAAQFRFPVGNAADGSGNVYIADDLNHRIRKIDPTQAVTTFAGSSAGFADGPAASALFNRPTGIAVDSSGTVYVADHDNNRIRKIAAGVVTTLAGNGIAASVDGTGTGAQFNNPIDIAVDNSGNLYVVEQLSHGVRQITPAGIVTTIAGSTTAGYGDGTGTATRFNVPFGIAVDSNGIIYVADAGNQRIRKLQSFPVDQIPAGTVLGMFPVGTSPKFLAVDAASNVWVANHDSNSVTKLSHDGTLLGKFPAGTGPLGLAIDPSGNVWVANFASSIGNTVTKLSSSGAILGTFPIGQFGPVGIAIDAAGDAWVSNSESDTSGGGNGTKVTKLRGSDGATLGNFTVGTSPQGIAVDASGNVWVCNFGSGGSGNTVTKLANDGSLLGTFTAGPTPNTVAIDGAGNAWVVVRTLPGAVKLAPSGAVQGTFPFGVAPIGIAVDNSDGAWVADNGGNTVVRLSSTGAVLGTFAVGQGPLGIALDRNNPFVWVTNNTANSVSKLATGGAKGRL